MGEFGIHLKFAKMLGGLSLAVIFITSITYFIFKKSRFIKYLPGFILFIIGLYNLYFLGADSYSANDINRLLIATMGMVTGIVGLSTGLIIGVYKKGRE